MYTYQRDYPAWSNDSYNRKLRGIGRESRSNRQKDDTNQNQLKNQRCLWLFPPNINLHKSNSSLALTVGFDQFIQNLVGLATNINKVFSQFVNITCAIIQQK